MKSLSTEGITPIYISSKQPLNAPFIEAFDQLALVVNATYRVPAS